MNEWDTLPLEAESIGNNDTTKLTTSPVFDHYITKNRT